MSAAPCCRKCDLDTHYCPGCGADASHEEPVCTDCSEPMPDGMSIAIPVYGPAALAAAFAAGAEYQRQYVLAAGGHDIPLRLPGEPGLLAAAAAYVKELR